MACVLSFIKIYALEMSRRCLLRRASLYGEEIIIIYITINIKYYNNIVNLIKNAFCNIFNLFSLLSYTLVLLLRSYALYNTLLSIVKSTGLSLTDSTYDSVLTKVTLE